VADVEAFFSHYQFPVTKQKRIKTIILIKNKFTKNNSKAANNSPASSFPLLTGNHFNLIVGFISSGAKRTIGEH
jgi:hypothetical protein